MKIQAKISGRTYTAKLPYDGAEFVTIDAPCPECGDCHAIQDTDLGPPATLALARGPDGIAAALVDWTDVPTVVTPPPTTTKLRGVGISEVHDGWNAAAVCCRCFRTVGTLHVRVSTIFGVKEDRAVQQRARCYG